MDRTNTRWCILKDARPPAARIAAEWTAGAVYHPACECFRYKCWFYDAALAAGTTAVLKNMNPDEMPDEIRDLKGKIDP